MHIDVIQQYEWLYYCVALQEKRIVPGVTYCVGPCLCLLYWQLSASCSGTSVSEVENLRSIIKLFLSLHQFSLLILCALVCVLYTACMCVFAVYYQCLLGKSCRMGGKCLSPSQWCDGVEDCSHGEDEAQCSKTYTPTPSLPNMWMCLVHHIMSSMVAW